MAGRTAPQWNIYNDKCPTRMALNRIADKWTVMIVGRLAKGTLRFGEDPRRLAEDADADAARPGA